MIRMKKTFRSFAIVLASLMALQSVAIGTANAGMIATETLAAPSGVDRVNIAAQLDRQEVRDALASNGVTVEEAEARIAALSDSEAALLAARIDEDPAGQAVGLILTAGLIALVILLVADATDHTDVF